ncbi:hypothetical protein KY284_037616 [Solanum tuberosum]|nr:hypothetical protein KY284_037616 [Solanum tuberosum]
MDIITVTTSLPSEIPGSDVTTLQGYTSKEISTIKWSTIGAGTSNTYQLLLMASASFDSTVKIWDVEQGRLLHSLNGHREAVYSIAFSPNGEYMENGLLDKCMNI